MSRCSNMRVQKPELFDHFVGPLLELHGHIEAKRLGGLEIDHELTTSAVAGPSAAGRRGPSSAGASLSRSELQPSWTSGCISTATPVRHRSSPTWRQRSVSHPRSSVGSRTGAPARHATFPVPSTSHAACGFPALRAPICFTPTLMGPILLGRLSARRVALDRR